MTQYWCVNFDHSDCLEHGLDKHFWMMQYQYADNHGNGFQSHKPGAISNNWRQLKNVCIGDWLVAYLPGNRYFAVGQVISPRHKKTTVDETTTIEKYLDAENSHKHKNKFVFYTDAPALYEDFKDNWRQPDDKTARYAQRIDVNEWQHIVPEGITMPGLGKFILKKPHLAVTQIDEPFFRQIEKQLNKTKPLSFILPGQSKKEVIPEEVDPSKTYLEGAVKSITVNAYERKQGARTKCIEHHGWACGVCGYDMAELYGRLGEGVIHVHHLRELSALGGEYEVDPINDLRPVCPNCHAILHTSSPAMTIKQLQKVLSKRKPIQWPAK